MTDTLLQEGRPAWRDSAADHHEVQYQHAYPADAKANPSLKTMVRGLGVTVSVSEALLSSHLIYNLYLYITTINHTPDTVMILSALYLMLSFLKFSQGLHSFHFAGQHTDRTPENWDSMLKLSKLTGIMHVVVTGGILGLISYIEGIATLDEQTARVAGASKAILAAQVVLFFGHHYTQRQLKNTEDAQARVVDTGAADAVRFALAKKQ